MIVRLETPLPEPAMHSDVVADSERLHNNFGLLRLGWAVAVLYSHCFPLVGGPGTPEPLGPLTSGQTTLGSVAVDGFFVISGFLIARSWRRSRSASDFIRKRILRIYPGLIVALVFSIVVGAYSAGAAWSVYLKKVAYEGDRVLQSLLFLRYGGVDQPQAFSTNPFPTSVNGVLWTLNGELRCYAIVVALGVFGLLGRRGLLRAFIAAAFVFYAVQTATHFGQMQTWFSRFLLYFLLGAYVAADESRLPRMSVVGFVAASALSLALTQCGILYSLLFPFVFAYLVFGLAFLRWTPGAALFARHDLSYGIYLYAFPVQQLLVQSLHLRSPYALFAWAVPITALLALASWRWVESPMLALKPKPAAVAA